MKKTKWLHISDLHLNKQGIETQRLRDRLLSLLQELGETDYLFISGDLQYAPNPPDIVGAVNYIKQIIAICHVPIEHVFIVPGNHDVDRSDRIRSETEKRVFGDENHEDGYYLPEDGIIKSEDIFNILKARGVFQKIINEVYRDIPSRLLEYNSQEKPHFVIETEDFNVIHLDSTLSYTKERQRDLYIGSGLLYDVIKSINTQKTSIILTHYSYDYMERREQNELIALMRDKNIRLWIAGHEHNNLVRMQRDFFYEFQAGNLLFEKQAKSCILMFEFDTESKDGTTRAFSWEPGEDWHEYPFIAPMNDEKRIYPFSVKDCREETGKDPFSREYSIPIRYLNNCIAAINLYSLNEKNLSTLPEPEFNKIKSQMGDRLSGKETNQQIISLFLAEINMTMNAGKRYDCLPLFQHVIRGVYDGYIYADDCITPLEKVKIYHGFFEDIDQYQIEGERFILLAVIKKNKTVGITYGYSLSDLNDVNDRIYFFENISKILHATNLLIRTIGERQLCVRIMTPLNAENDLEEKRWKEKVENTDRWIEQMHKISAIEDYYDIKFVLPKSATAEDFMAIDIIYSSTIKERCCSIPGIPFSIYNSIKSHFDFPETEITERSKLPELRLFGHSFKPRREYILACQLIKNKAKKIWETKEGGVPICVDFAVDQE